MRWLSRLTTIGILVVLGLAVLVAAIELARPPAATGAFRTSALFRDASGLPIGSRVVIAGVNVGRIESLTIEGNRARIAMRLSDDTVLCDDAWATKKATSALGDNYIELSPGEAEGAGCLPPHRRLVSGEPVPRVIEAASTERVLRGIQNAMPRIDEGMASAEAFLDEGREWVSGPFSARLAQLDRDLSGDMIAGPIRDADRAADDLDRWTADLAADVSDVAPTINRRMDDFAADVAGATGDMRGARADMKDAMAGARARIDEVDPFLDDAGDTIAALANPRHERSGQLAKMIHDPELADDLEDVSESGVSFTRSLSKFKNVIGFRTEVNFLARQPTYYVTAELAARSDTFYYLEMQKGHWGDVPEPSLDSTGTPTWNRRTIIVEDLRFTAQWGKRFGPLALRAGVKESLFGVGVDGILGNNGRLKLSLDVMESSFARVPRVKLAAALAVYRTLYIVGGIDEALVEGGDLAVLAWPDGDDVPTQFRELHYGRDFFLGVSLNFTDSDMDRLLFVYGGLLGAILSR